MKATRNLIQAYRQAPWRQQVQWASVILGAIFAVALVAAVYLNVTGRAATIGRIVQGLQNDREDMEQRIEDLQTQLAGLTSVSTMRGRAEDLGFQPLDPSQVTYVTVPEYQGRATAQLAPHSSQLFDTSRRLPPEYTTSLFEWFDGFFGGGN